MLRLVFGRIDDENGKRRQGYQADGKPADDKDFGHGVTDKIMMMEKSKSAV